MADTDLDKLIMAKLAYLDVGWRARFYARTNSTAVPLSEFLYPSEIREIEEQFHITFKGSKYADWKYVGSHDDNAGSGMVGILIETAPGKASICFRGTEFEGGLQQIFNDFGRADIGLLNSLQTVQHKEVDKMMQSFQQKGVFDRYKVTMIGHSLGGNLAQYATIKAVDMGLDDRIESCISLEGPGFSDAFIQKYKEQIRKVSGKMVHYRWSVVSTLMYDLEDFGVEEHVIQVKDENAHWQIMKHCLQYVKIDGDNFVIDEDGLRFWEESVGFVSHLTDTIVSAADNASRNVLIGSFGRFGAMIYYGGHQGLGILSGALSSLFAGNTQKEAREKAAKDPYFYLNIDSYREIAEGFLKVNEDLKTAIDGLCEIHKLPTITVDIPDEIWGDTIIENALNRLQKKIRFTPKKNCLKPSAGKRLLIA